MTQNRSDFRWNKWKQQNNIMSRPKGIWTIWRWMSIIEQWNENVLIFVFLFRRFRSVSMHVLVTSNYIIIWIQIRTNKKLCLARCESTVISKQRTEIALCFCFLTLNLEHVQHFIDSICVCVAWKKKVSLSFASANKFRLPFPFDVLGFVFILLWMSYNWRKPSPRYL